MNNSKDKEVKLLWIQTHPTQYVSPLLDKISRNKKFNFKAIYLSDFSTKEYFDYQFKKKIRWNINLIKNHEYIFLNTRSKSINFFNPLIFPSKKFLKLIIESNYIVIQGWQNYSLILIGIIGKLFGKKIIQRSETPVELKLGSKKIFKKSIFHKILSTVSLLIADYFLYIGELNKRYYLSRKINFKRLFFSPYSVDNNFFNDQKLNLKDNKNFINFNNDLPTMLYASKLIERKNILGLLEQYQRNFKNNLNLIIVGSGPLTDKVKKIIQTKKLENVKFLGFVNQKELPNLYSLSDIFILPSYYENWGLVINEAMCNSCAIITSNEVGAAYDLVIHKENGYVFDTNEDDSISTAIDYCLHQKRFLSMGIKSKNIIKSWNYDETINSLSKIIFDKKNI